LRRAVSEYAGWEDIMAALPIRKSTRAYEQWLREQLRGDIIEQDIKTKHLKMSEAPFPFLRATYWRWAETILDVCPKLANAPQVLAVGDLHLENFGTWRDTEGRLIWGVNDFDEAALMPYPLDLVRLGVSAFLACEGVATHDELCDALLDGYRRGLADPHPIVLERDYAWLRNLVIVPEPDRAHFWDKMRRLAVKSPPPPRRFVKVLSESMPAARLKLVFHPRTAGAGSLGRPRWVGIGDYNGAPAIREAKAVVPSAWVRGNSKAGQAHRCFEIATGRYRSPDPWYRLTDNIVVRRLSPNNRKIEAVEHPAELARKKMLRAMGRDVAAIHLGSADRRKAILADLDGRKRKWLVNAVEAAADFVRRDYRDWKKG
jgi:hypothetical protein